MTTKQEQATTVGERADRAEAGLGGTTVVRTRRHVRLATWHRRHLNVRKAVAVIARLSLLAPGVAAIIDAAI